MSSFSTDKKDIRKFGIVALVFFGTLCAIGVWRQKMIVGSIFGSLGALGLGFVLLPEVLRPVYCAWLTVARIIGQIVTAGVLTLAYYLVITPSALIKRIFGGRPLPIRPDKNATTYWVDREEPLQPKDRFIKRY